MSCDEFVELVTAYLEGALPEAERTAFVEHLSECPGCDRYLAQFRQTIELLGASPAEALTEPARRRLLTAFAEWCAGSGGETP